jgi:hypothetical protein
MELPVLPKSPKCWADLKSYISSIYPEGHKFENPDDSNPGFKRLDTILQRHEGTYVFANTVREFGQFVPYEMKTFHYFNCEKKIACIDRGYEAFYPSADGFIYDFKGPKIGDFHHGGSLNWTRDEAMIAEFTRDIHSKIPDAKIIYKFDNAGDDVFSLPLAVPPFYDSPVAMFTWLGVNFPKTKAYGIEVDLVFSNRNKGVNPNLDVTKRNFQHWDVFIAHMISKKLRIGAIGRKDMSYKFNGIINSFDYNNPSVATIEMLQSANFYVGTDTGPTHLASLFDNLNIFIFRKLWDAGRNGVLTYNKALDYYEHMNPSRVYNCKALDDDFNNVDLLISEVEKRFNL